MLLQRTHINKICRPLQGSLYRLIRYLLLSCIIPKNFSFFISFRAMDLINLYHSIIFLQISALNSITFTGQIKQVSERNMNWLSWSEFRLRELSELDFATRFGILAFYFWLHHVYTNQNIFESPQSSKSLQDVREYTRTQLSGDCGQKALASFSFFIWQSRKFSSLGYQGDYQRRPAPRPSPQEKAKLMGKNSAEHGRCYVFNS